MFCSHLVRFLREFVVNQVFERIAFLPRPRTHVMFCIMNYYIAVLFVCVCLCARSAVGCF